MITARLIQAIELGLTELHEGFTSETNAAETIADMGIGPRALGRLVDRYADQFGETPEIGFANAFLVGVLTERLTLGVMLGLIPEEELLASINDQEEPYEEAPVEDLQDTLQMLYGIHTDDGVSLEEIKGMLLKAVQDDPSSDGELPEDLIQALSTE